MQVNNTWSTVLMKVATLFAYSVPDMNEVKGKRWSDVVIVIVVIIANRPHLHLLAPWLAFPRQISS